MGGCVFLQLDKEFIKLAVSLRPPVNCGNQNF